MHPTSLAVWHAIGALRLNDSAGKVEGVSSGNLQMRGRKQRSPTYPPRLHSRSWPCRQGLGSDRLGQAQSLGSTHERKLDPVLNASSSKSSKRHLHFKLGASAWRGPRAKASSQVSHPRAPLWGKGGGVSPLCIQKSFPTPASSGVLS